MPARSALTRGIALALAVVSGQAAAAQFTYTLYAGIEHNDNVNESPTDPISQNIFIPGISFNYLQQGSTIQANVAGDLEYRDYLGNAFSDQTLTQLNGKFNWTVAPQRLDFTVEDYAGVQPISTLSTNAPNNQQQTNVVSLGPTLYFLLGQTLHGQIELRYINSYASKDTDFDSSRGQAALRIFKDIDPTDQLSANAQSEHVDFNGNSDNLDYDLNELYARYDRKLANFDFGMELGWSQISFNQAPSATTPLAQFTVDWRATAHSTFNLTATRQYADVADDLMTPQDQFVTHIGPGINTGIAEINSQVYLERSVLGSYSYTTEGFTLSVAPMYRKFDYLNDSYFNQTNRGANAGISYNLRPDLSVSAFANEEVTTYQTLDERDKQLNYGVGLTDQRTPHWALHFSVSHSQRSSTAAGQGYNYNVIYLGIEYRR